jgi:beta-lactamase class D
VIGVPRTMRVVARILSVLALVLGASSSRVSAAPPPDPFTARGVEGAFVLLDTSSDTWTVVHRGLAETRMTPQSTYKIPNTLIGLETGVITGEQFSLKWDGVDRQIPDWNRDQDLASALKYSVVWFYQEVARRIGAKRMSRWVNRLGYGNRNSAGGVIDRFWLDGPLRISPVEQVDFLRRLHAYELPVSREHADLLLRLIELDRGKDWVLRGKTGLGFERKRAIGWLVGSVDRGGRRWIYATVMLGESTEQLKPLRRPITEELLRRFGALPPT